jgi:hypothetical protein
VALTAAAQRAGLKLFSLLIVHVVRVCKATAAVFLATAGSRFTPPDLLFIPAA